MHHFQARQQHLQQIVQLVVIHLITTNPIQLYSLLERGQKAERQPGIAFEEETIATC